MTDQGQTAARDADGGASLRETARQLQMSVTTVKRWADNGWLTSTATDTGERRFLVCPVVVVVPAVAPVEEGPPRTTDDVTVFPEGGSTTP